ncbi:hypothetical protein HIM_00048 [Hirsutella minnesotensis 3608]|nr:hypothetical protein HIM_00048 [Hirsutella minnesotensis 3608]
MTDPAIPSLNLPSKYAPGQAAPVMSCPPPTNEWLTETWTVTHSTLSMWRSARNVRISYMPLPAKADGSARINDLVEYEPTNKTGVRKTVEGIDTQATTNGWDWRGKGLLFFVSSHWEILGWGEETTEAGSSEKWAVTWFAPTLFTKEGLDVYCDQREGISEGTYKKVEAALKKLDAPKVVAMVEQDMRPVEIKLPWTEK